MLVKGCPCCMKAIIHTELRMAELPPKEVIGYTRTRYKLVIGKLYYHKDGTVCDQAFWSVKKLQTPTYLRLGDPDRDPRN